MFRRIDDFAEVWRLEAATTLSVLRALTDASLAERVGEGRTLGRLAWHLAETVPEMLGHAGIRVDGAAPRDDTPATAAEIVEGYERGAASVPAAVASAWTDADLEKEVQMYGETWTRDTVLAALIMHQAHHRGQMTVLMRMAGLRVPGCYGPSAEEWTEMGMPVLS